MLGALAGKASQTRVQHIPVATRYITQRAGELVSMNFLSPQNLCAPSRIGRKLKVTPEKQVFGFIGEKNLPDPRAGCDRIVQCILRSDLTKGT